MLVCFPDITHAKVNPGGRFGGHGMVHLEKAVAGVRLAVRNESDTKDQAACDTGVR
jgi:hypothetical protein